MQDVGKAKLENTLQFTNNEDKKRMQAQETLLGCLQCFRREKKVKGSCTTTLG
jgi:hypothetical protein